MKETPSLTSKGLQSTALMRLSRSLPLKSYLQSITSPSIPWWTSWISLLMTLPNPQTIHLTLKSETQWCRTWGIHVKLLCLRIRTILSTNLRITRWRIKSSLKFYPLRKTSKVYLQAVWWASSRTDNIMLLRQSMLLKFKFLNCRTSLRGWAQMKTLLNK